MPQIQRCEKRCVVHIHDELHSYRACPQPVNRSAGAVAMKTCVITLVVVCLAILASASAGRGVEAQSTPPVIQTSHPVPNATVYVNETFNLRFSMRRRSGDSGHGGISVSFPDFTLRNAAGSVASRYDSAQGTVSTAGYTNGASRVTYLSNGYWPLNEADGGVSAAEYLLVESDDPEWSPSDDRTLTLRITPKGSGEFPLQIRGWICGEEYTRCKRNPVSGDAVDQQGYGVDVVTVVVSGDAN